MITIFFGLKKGIEKIMKIMPNALCWCGSKQKYKRCHMNYDSIIKMKKKEGFVIPKKKWIKNGIQIEGIRESGKINTAILDYITDKIYIGMPTEEIDRLIYEKTKELGGIPAPLGYEGYPKSVCTSINDVVCHGIPSERDVLCDGDIINVDVSTVYKGYFSDSSRTFLLGNVKPEVEKLVRVTKECIELGLEEVAPWETFGKMSSAIDKHAQKHGYSVVREIGGHGVGLEFHEEPWIGYTDGFGEMLLMTPGMIFTIEPMINMGDGEIYVDEEDGWTVYTSDGQPSAQWEIMVLVTETGYEVLAW